MKQYAVLSVVLGISLLSYTQPAGEFRIEGHVREGMKRGKAYLRYFTPERPFSDSAIIKDGKFEISGKVPARLTIGKLSVMDENDNTIRSEQSTDVWLEAGQIKIETLKKLSDAKFEGSASQRQFGELTKALAPIVKKNTGLDEEYEKAVFEKDTAIKDSLVNIAYPALFKEKQKVLGAFIRKYPQSMISAYQFSNFAGDGEMNLELVEQVFELLAPDIKKHPQVQSVAERIDIAKKTAPGMEAPGFIQTDTSGQVINLLSFRGKYLLMDFWAGWCIPCRAENPLLLRLYTAYKHKNFEILGVSLDGERKRWTNAIRDDKLMWTQVSDLQIFDNVIAKRYGITSIPQNILIGPDGKIIAKNLRGSILEKKLAEIFK